VKQAVKLIVFDLDGTLLRDDKTVSEYTKDIILQCRKSGYKTAIATGRGGGAEDVAPPELFDGRVLMNGALALIDDRIVYSRLIPYKVARPLLVACDEHHLRAASQSDGMHYSNFAVSDKWHFVTDFEIVDFNKHERDAEKLYVVIDDSETTHTIEKYLPDELYTAVSRDGLAMIMHKEATKSNALAELARNWDISRSEILAFGDDVNDLDLLEYVGVSVAMGNALPQVKAVADYVCGDNENDGIGKWLKENLL
jgi:Cof subfamily protein (haloacid dehalogenase superfamily)